jgi:large repetitive protein
VADDAELNRIQYTGSWKEQPPEVHLSGFGTRTLHLQAAGDARPGTTGTITVGVTGSQPVPATLRVVVGAAPPPTVSPVTVDGVVAGRSAAFDIARYVYSPLHDRVISIVSLTPVSGMGASRHVGTTSVTLTPNADAHGTEVFQVVVTDVTDRTRTERQAVGRITLHVLGVPDPPTGVSPGRDVLSHQVTLTWAAPANNGEPIDFYQVSYSGSTHRCPASPCTITGLTNGVEYVFTVRAHNAVGFGKPSAPSRPGAQPNAVPQAPTGLHASDPQDGRLQLTWQPAKVDGTPVLKYAVSYNGHVLTTTATSIVATGLDNDVPTTFRVTAVNKQGSGPAATVRGQSAGVPQYPPSPAAPHALPAPHLDTTQAGDHQVVRVSWTDIDPNGPGPVTYAVTRRATGHDPVVVCSGVRATTCADPDVVNDGSDVSYTYVATNGAGHSSDSSDSASFAARGTPEGISGFRATGTGADHKVELSFTVAPVRDRSSTVYCTIGSADGASCGTFQFDGPNAVPGQDKVVDVGADGPVTVFLKQCNTVGTCADPASADAVAFGQLQPPAIQNARSSGPNVDFEVHWNPRGGAVQLQVTVQTSDGTVYDHTFDESDPTEGDDSVRFTDDVDATLNTPISVNPGTFGKQVRITAVLSDASNLHRSTQTSVDDSVKIRPPITASLARTADSGCTSSDPAPCADLTLHLHGFQANGHVVCHFDVQGGAALADVTVDTDAGGDGDWQSGKYTSGGAKITVTCETITDQMTW